MLNVTISQDHCPRLACRRSHWPRALGGDVAGCAASLGDPAVSASLGLGL